ncbi:unnamed protein product [Spirodela intermedia]|uniref:AAA+ ATPase domain-containing protein n=1 Tax=Spirodela intermedia TaxID=51605 RepID=A0A7I8J380_SPIIN|nr:unnamed protein product [Spirodela intermedia]CAA6664696.1 unnamed protein product [Spirodela intermedia]
MEFLSQMWSFLGLLTVLQNVLPSQLLRLLHSLWQSLQDALTPYSYFDVPEFNGSFAVEPNDLYRHVLLYLHSSLLDGGHHPNPSTRLILSRPRNSPQLSLSVAPNHAVEDQYEGHRLLWAHNVDTVQDSLEERRWFSLRAPKRFSRSGLLLPYLSHVSGSAADFEHLSRDRRLYTNVSSATGCGGGGCWASVPFRHPATFETLALEPVLKSRLLADLSAFAAGRDFYSRVGRAWKRGYLLHGPPGCGKSSLVAAMANHLRYDVFDLELTKVSGNSELRSLLIQTTNRSIIVIEDIDCSLNLTADRAAKEATSSRARRLTRSRHHREETDGSEDDDDGTSQRVTLSGLLNFTDGLWSCCGEERIIVFTTNHKDGVDPALLRSGRMDVHLRLGACGPHAFRELVRSYLGVEDHGLIAVAESCIRSGGALTPAEIGEVLLRNRGDADAAISEAVAEMQARALACGGNVKGSSDGGEGDSEMDEREQPESPGGSWEMVTAASGGLF